MFFHHCFAYLTWDNVLLHNCFAYLSWDNVCFTIVLFFPIVIMFCFTIALFIWVSIMLYFNVVILLIRVGICFCVTGTLVCLSGTCYGFDSPVLFCSSGMTIVCFPGKNIWNFSSYWYCTCMFNHYLKYILILSIIGGPSAFIWNNSRQSQ